MIEYDEIKQNLLALSPRLEELSRALDPDTLKGQIAELEEQSGAAGFWDDPQNSSKVLQKLSSLKAKLSQLQELQTRLEDAQTLIEMAEEANDASFVDEARESEKALDRDLSAALMQTLLSGEYDNRTAIVTLHAGAGGTEAQDWVEMLFRMYQHWAESHRFKFTLLDQLEGDEAGLKSVSFEVAGENAYGYLKGEQKQIGWGSQIRSYVFMPYTLVKDHRTGFEMGNIGAVMDGDLDGFINAYLTALSQGKIG